MATKEDVEDDDDDFFAEVYGREYSGPAAGRDSTRMASQNQESTISRVRENSEERETPRDPNELPTDFTTREAKLWDAKAKAMERNWKRRREEELTCRICGEMGHFAQGCPTTLGGGARPGEHVQRMAIKDRRMKPRLIGTGGSVIQGIEKSSGCRIKLEDNLVAGDGSFTVHITGSNEEKVKKAQDAVNSILKQVEEEWQKQAQRKVAGGVGGKVQVEHRVVPVSPSPGRPGQPRPASEVVRGDAYHSPSPLLPVGPRPLAAVPRSGAAYLKPDSHMTEQIAAHLELRRKWESAGAATRVGFAAPPYSSAAPPAPYDETSVRASGAYDAPLAARETPQANSLYYSQEVQGGESNAYGEAATSSAHGDSAVLRSSSQAGASAGEEDMEVGYDDSGSVSNAVGAESLEDLEQQFLEQTMALTRAQTAEENAEHARHKQRMVEIGEVYQKRMATLRAEQTDRRQAFLQRHSKGGQGQQAAFSPYHYSPHSGSVPPSGPPSGHQQQAADAVAPLYGASSMPPLYASRAGESTARSPIGGSSGAAAERATYSGHRQGDGAGFSAYSGIENGTYSSSHSNPEAGGLSMPQTLQHHTGASYEPALDRGHLPPSKAPLQAQTYGETKLSYTAAVGTTFTQTEKAYKQGEPDTGYEINAQEVYSQAEPYTTASAAYALQPPIFNSAVGSSDKDGFSNYRLQG